MQVLENKCHNSTKQSYKCMKVKHQDYTFKLIKA
jgi:hypothetical protein